MRDSCAFSKGLQFYNGFHLPWSRFVMNDKLIEERVVDLNM